MTRFDFAHEVRRGLVPVAMALSILACGLPSEAPAGPPSATLATPTATPSPMPPATATATSTATPLAPPATGWIVFTCQLFADARFDQICRIRPDGTAWERLTQDDTSDHFYPSSAGPDDVVYSANPDGPFDIYEWQSGVITRLTTLGEAYAPAISPAGDQLVFTLIRGEVPSLWLAGRFGEGPRQLVANAWDATWSPDGAQILHASDRDGTTQLWTIDVETADLRKLTAMPGLRGRNDWSSDGRWIATYAGEPWLRELVMLSPNGDTVSTLTNGGNNLAPSFSPDSSWLAFTSYRDRYREDDGCEIYVMALEDARTYRLTDNEYCDWQPRWGPG